MTLGSWKRRSRLGRWLRLNLSASARNGPSASVSAKAGPVTINPRRRRVSVRLPGGFTWRGRW